MQVSRVPAGHGLSHDMHYYYYYYYYYVNGNCSPAFINPTTSDVYHI